MFVPSWGKKHASEFSGKVSCLFVFFGGPTNSRHYQMWNQCYGGQCLSIVTWYFCDGRVNKFPLLLSFSTPTLKILLSPSQSYHVPGWRWKKAWSCPWGIPFLASSEVSCTDGSLPSVLRTQNVARQQVQQPSFSDLWAAEEEKQTSLTSNRMHLCVFRRRPLKEVLLYFQDKVSFMRAMCWTNQVNWEARNPHWVYLSFLLKADSADRGCLLSP